MKAFADLYYQLDETTRTNEKVDALAHYFKTADPADAAWAVLFLTGRRLARVVKAPNLRAWSSEAAETPDWLFLECYDAVGDMAETMALLFPTEGESERIDRPLHEWIEHILLRIRDLPEPEQKSLLLDSWKSLDERARFVWNKLITGAFRVGASKQLVVKALAKAAGIEESTISHRLMGDWSPTEKFFLDLISKDSSDTDISRPYPFYLAYAVEGSPESELGDSSLWRLEWKWDGIRAQLIRRGESTFVWSRGEELVTDRFPEIKKLGDALPSGTVIDGEILAWKGDSPLPFAQLQRRIGRKTLGKKLLGEAPVILMAFDLLEANGLDVRNEPLELRLGLLSRIADQLPWLGGEHLRIAPAWFVSQWTEAADLRTSARENGAEGLMLKRLGSAYGVGRRRGDWWKWKVDPLTTDAVLIAAQRGSGKRASLYTDYTFGVWHNSVLVPIAKAYSGLSDSEIRQVDAFIRKNMVEKFGPVRTVRPVLVFELAFEGINLSPRHKSGIAVRFPRILRQRLDKTPDEADSLERLKLLVKSSKPLPLNEIEEIEGVAEDF